MDNKKLLWGGILIAIVIAIGGAWLGLSKQSPAAPPAGGVTNYDSVETAALAVGSGCDNQFSSCVGTTISKALTGSCTLTAYNNVTAWAASTTKLHYCSVSNVAAGDVVMVALPNFGGAQGLGVGTQQLLVTGYGYGFATTSGTLEVPLWNGAGAATSSYPYATSSVLYWVIDS